MSVPATRKSKTAPPAKGTFGLSPPWSFSVVPASISATSMPGAATNVPWEGPRSAAAAGVEALSEEIVLDRRRHRDREPEGEQDPEAPDDPGLQRGDAFDDGELGIRLDLEADHQLDITGMKEKASARTRPKKRMRSGS